MTTPNAYQTTTTLPSFSALCEPSHSGQPQSSSLLTGPLRRGKWTRAEEEYAAATIRYFCDGLLPIQYGTTLRGYLAQQLHCDPMRISKKLVPGCLFAGIKISPKIGRSAYYPCARDSPSVKLRKHQAESHLQSLRAAFIRSIEDDDNCSVVSGGSRSSAPNSPAKHGRKRTHSASCKIDDAMQMKSAQYSHVAAPGLTLLGTHASLFQKLPKIETNRQTSSSNPPMLPPLHVSLMRTSHS